MLPLNTNQNYRSFSRLKYGNRSYGVLFYEKEGSEYTCKDKITEAKRNEICNWIAEAMFLFHEADFGCSFYQRAYGTTDDDQKAFNKEDKLSYIVCFYKHKQWAGRGLLVSDTQIGIDLSISENTTKENIFSLIKHEMEHALGFGHKTSVFGTYLNWRNADFVMKLEKEGGLSLDTLHGLDVVYQIHPKILIQGRVENSLKFLGSQAYIVDWETKKLCYQSQVDHAGYFEFRLRYPLKKWSVFVCHNDNVGHISYALTDRQKMKVARYDVGWIKLDNLVYRVEDIEINTPINIKGI